MKMTQDDIVLTVNQLTVQFGGLTALKDVDLEVKEGTRHGILGPNGAGKTTLFNVITGFVKPHSGNVWLRDRDITHLPAHTRVHLGIVRTFQLTTLLPKFTALENVLIGAFVRLNHHRHPWRSARQDQSAQAVAEALLKELRLEHLRDTRVRNMGYGEQRQLEIAVALAVAPRILLLDEPTAGLSEAETRVIIDLIQRLPKQLTIVIIEHSLNVVFKLADHLTVLHYGKRIADGPTDAVRQDPVVKEVYLGSN